MGRCAVLGKPIEHSLSPVMHRAAYAQFDIDWQYEAIEVPAGGLADFLAGCDDSWQGFSVTAPLKTEAAELAVVRSSVVEELGVANTLIPGRDGWIASNTDVPGALAALRGAGIEQIETLRVLGAGATAMSLVLVADSLGARGLDLRVRDPQRAGELVEFAERLGMEVRVSDLTVVPDGTVDLLVNTIPAAALAGSEGALVVSARNVFDVVYDPWPTPLMEAAAETYTPLVTGIDLLAHQAVLQVTAMTGRHVEAEVLVQAALAELARRP